LSDESTESDAPVSLQFYNDVAPLVYELGRAMSVALDQGHGAVCVVADATRRILEEQLTMRGIDVGALRSSGQYVYLDGEEALTRICVGGNPNGRRFASVVGTVVDRLSAKYPSVWMYGELAALMWNQGNKTGAIELDKLWAAFSVTHPVCLCVAFPVEALTWPIVIEALREEVADQIRTLAKGSAIALAIHRGPKH
jgi:hypothetical protein